MKPTITRALTLIVALVLLLPAAYHAAATGQQDKKKQPPTDPQGTSPARPGIEVPDVDHWYCWRCGAANSFPKEHYKSGMHRPMLVIGPDQKEALGKSRMVKELHSGPVGPARGGNAAIHLLLQGEEIGLSGEQRRRLEDLARNSNLELVDLLAKLGKEQLELRKAIQDDAGLSSLKRQVETVARARVAVQTAQLSCLIESKSILTDEQREKLKSMRPGLGGILD